MNNAIPGLFDDNTSRLWVTNERSTGLRVGVSTPAGTRPSKELERSVYTNLRDRFDPARQTQSKWRYVGWSEVL